MQSRSFSRFCFFSCWFDRVHGVSLLGEMVDESMRLLIGEQLCGVRSKQLIGQLVGCGIRVHRMSRSCSSRCRHLMTSHRYRRCTN